MQNDAALKEFIKENSSLFWYIPEKEKENINHDVLVEFILNYGNEKSVKKLFDLLGIENVADIFHKLTKRKRVNFFPPVVNYFNLYFKRYAHSNIK